MIASFLYLVFHYFLWIILPVQFYLLLFGYFQLISFLFLNCWCRLNFLFYPGWMMHTMNYQHFKMLWQTSSQMHQLSLRVEKVLSNFAKTIMMETTLYLFILFFAYRESTYWHSLCFFLLIWLFSGISLSNGCLAYIFPLLVSFYLVY